jgi:hypothetical protein
MKQAIVLAIAIALILLPASPVCSEDEQPAPDEKVLIEKAIRDYIDGWYDGDAERMTRALHPDLTKRRVVALPNGRELFNTVSADAMIEYTSMGFGKKSKKEGQVNEVIILDISPQTATAKSISHEFIDYIHLAKVNGQWRIINVLWELTKP